MEWKKASRWLGVLLGVALAAQLALATTVSGTIKINQVPFNGAFTYRLIYPTSAGGTGYLSLPAASDPVPVTNGQFASLTLDGNDIMLPRGTFYQLAFTNNYGAAIATLNYYISGSTYDLGTAVPTPVTTNNVNFLDLLGIRNFSTTNMSVLNCFNVGSGAATPQFCPTGITGLKNLDGVQYADGYNGIGSSTTTCGIAEAEAALPAAGGTVVLPLGTCTLTTTVVHTKSARWIGHGLGTTLISTAQYLVDAQGWLQIEGAALQGGTTATIFEENTLYLRTVGVSGSSGSGVIAAAGTNANFNTCTFTGNAGSGVVANGATLHAYSSSFNTNTADGITANAGSVVLVNSAATANTGAGVNVPVGSTTVVDWEGGLGAGNTQAGVSIQAGNHHVIQNVDLRGNGRQLYGAYLNLPAGANAQLAQVTLKDNQMTGNLTDDFYVGVNSQRIYYYPLANTQAAAGYTQNILAPNAVFYIGYTNSPTAFTESFNQAGCTLATSTDSTCSGTITLASPMPDTAYQPVIQAQTTGAFVFATVTGSLTTTTFPYTLTCTFNCATIPTPNLFIIARHN